MTVDINELTKNIKDTVSGIIDKDITTVRGFSNRQLTGIANQTSLVALGIASGEITDFTRDFFLDQLIELARNFVNTLVGLLITTVERLWNTVVSILWGAISKATGVVLAPFNPL